MVLTVATFVQQVVLASAQRHVGQMYSEGSPGVNNRNVHNTLGDTDPIGQLKLRWNCDVEETKFLHTPVPVALVIVAGVPPIGHVRPHAVAIIFVHAGHTTAWLAGNPTEPMAQFTVVPLGQLSDNWLALFGAQNNT